MVSGFASGSIAVDVTLDAVVLRAADVDRTTLHEEILGAVDTVAHCRCHVDGGVFDGEVLARLDAVLHVTHHVQRTLLCKLSVALDVEATLL